MTGFDALNTKNVNDESISELVKPTYFHAKSQVFEENNISEALESPYAER